MDKCSHLEGFKCTYHLEQLENKARSEGITTTVSDLHVGFLKEGL